MVAACDLSPDRLHEAERRAAGVRTGTDLGALLGASDVDAVIVATDATRHYEVARAALEAGKDCLVEKPLTTDVDQARELRDLARRKNRLLMSGQAFRSSPGIIPLRKGSAPGAPVKLDYLTSTG